MSRLDKLLKTMADAPDGQIDGAMTKRISRLIGCTNEVVVTELTEIRDECVQSSLCSAFAMEVINQAIEIAQVKD